MHEFNFLTDEKGLTFCRKIALEMLGLFKIFEEEANGRINRQWEPTPK